MTEKQRYYYVKITEITLSQRNSLTLGKLRKKVFPF